MRGDSECCHYDEGYDDGLADGREESDNQVYANAVRETLVVARILVEQGDEIPESLTLSEIEEILADEQRRNARMAMRYREALAR